jgi:pimeloyl-ACP methyl ester carboxylesterase
MLLRTALRCPRLLLWIVVLLLIIGAGAPAGAQPDESVFYAEADCPFPAPERVTCGVLTVPEDRAQPAGYTVELAVAIIHPRSSSAYPVPVVYLEGGPGGSALLSLDEFLKSPLVEDRMLILFDQRGTGFSIPSLNCPEIEQASGDNPVEACRDRLLDEGIDLQMYSSAASAADVHDLVRALGYDQVDLWGISYGTKLGLTVLRDFQEIVRSAVLDSVYAPETDDFQIQTTGFLDAINALFARCAADPACDAAYPDLEGDFYALLDDLDASPAEIEADDGLITLDGATLYHALFQTLYDTKAIPFLPYGMTLMAYAEDEDDLRAGYSILAGVEFPVDTGAALLDEIPLAESDEVLAYMDEFGQIDDSEGMAFSVDCQEEYLLSDASAGLRLAESVPAPLSTYLTDAIHSNLADCVAWGVKAEAREAQRVTSAIPTLLFAGRFDPVTPVSSAESALQGLSNGRLLVFPAAGHGITVTETDSGACAAALMLNFLDNPAAPLDAGCIAATDVIDFYID